MANYEVVFDLGSQYISAGLKEDGYFVKVPSVVAVDNTDPHRIVGVGVAAINAGGGSASNCKLVYPILEGTVVDVVCAKALFNELFKRVLPSKAKIFSYVKVTCVVPCAIISSDKKTIESIFLSLGARVFNFLESPLADSLALFREFHAVKGLIVNIGYDCVDFSVVYYNNIVAGSTLFYSGKHLTQAIAEKIRSKYQVQLSFEQAELLKVNCASLYPNDMSTYTVSCVNLQTGASENINISSKELYDTVVEFVRKYCNVIRSLLASVNDTVCSVASEEGVFLCGGGALLQGLDSFMHTELALPVRVADDPANVSITGSLMYSEKPQQ